MTQQDTAEANRGSVWRKWDLHIHAPGTKLSNEFGNPNDECWNQYIDALEMSNIAAFGITDYFSVDCFANTVARYKERHPTSQKLLIPNIEFRLSESISKDAKHVNMHVLFDPETVTIDRIRTFLADVKTHITRDDRQVRCSDLRSADYGGATVSLSDLRKVVKDCFAEEEVLLVAAGNNDGLRSRDVRSQRSLSISEEIDKASDAFFGKAINTEFFLDTKRYASGDPADPKPVYDASDAHSLSDLARLSGEEPNFQSTWIKADVTFRGLRQTLFEPRDRVFIGDRPAVLVRQEREAPRFISKLEVKKVPSYNGENGDWFSNVNIHFSPELTAIIGNKGSGKSAIADILALLGETRQSQHFSFLVNSQGNKKFKRPGFAENFHGRVLWHDENVSEKMLHGEADPLKPELVKYLPQNYFERLTNEIEVQEFRKEIEDVVFSHVDESDKIGTSNFKELQEKKTATAKRETSSLKTQLREINLRIAELEEQAEPSFRKKLQSELDGLLAEIAALTASLPAAIDAPPDGTPEQKAMDAKIAALTAKLAKVNESGRAAIAQQTALKSRQQNIIGLKEALDLLKTNFDDEKENLKTLYASLGFDFDSMIALTVDYAQIDSGLAEVEKQLAEVEVDNSLTFNDEVDVSMARSVPDLRSLQGQIRAEIKILQDTLSAPQQRYQKNLQARREIQEKIDAIQGSPENAKPGSVHYLAQQIKRIEDELPAELTRTSEARRRLAGDIIKSKERIRDFHASLKQKVESRLGELHADFAVSIDASFVLGPTFEEEFFSHVSRTPIGPFRGVNEGQKALQDRVSAVDWNDMDSVLAFGDSIVTEMKKDDIKRQVRDVKKFYDFLFSFDYFDAKYELRLGGKDLNQLSPGEKGLLLLVFYLFLDMDRTPLVIDQPEDNLDNDSIFAVLAQCIRQAKKYRQVILVTHNPNLAIGADAEQIVFVKLDKAKNYSFTYEAGSVEDKRINDHCVKVLEGTRPAFVKRRLRYQI